MKELITLIEEIEIYQRAASEFLELLLNNDDDVKPYYNILDLVYNAHNGKDEKIQK